MISDARRGRRGRRPGAARNERTLEPARVPFVLPRGEQLGDEGLGRGGGGE